MLPGHMGGPTSSLASSSSPTSGPSLGRDKSGSHMARYWVPSFGTNRHCIWDVGSPRSSLRMHCLDTHSRTLEMRIAGPSQVVLRWSEGSRCYPNRNLVPWLACHRSTIHRATRHGEWPDCTAMGSHRHTGMAMAEFFLVIEIPPWSKRERTYGRDLAGPDTSAYLTCEHVYRGLSGPARAWLTCSGACLEA